MLRIEYANFQPEPDRVQFFPSLTRVGFVLVFMSLENAM